MPSTKPTPLGILPLLADKWTEAMETNTPTPLTPEDLEARLLRSWDEEHHPEDTPPLPEHPTPDEVALILEDLEPITIEELNP